MINWNMHFLSVVLLCGFFIKVKNLFVDVNDVESVCETAKKIQQGEWDYYEGFRPGGWVGMFHAPYYWWQAGSAFGGLLDYYFYCQKDNSTLRDVLFEGIYHQAGEDFDYIPVNQTKSEGNDDHCIWGMTTMLAAEKKFKDPPHSWLEMTQAIYNKLNLKWDTTTCQGGLRWQKIPLHSGYNYKNSISNGCLFHLAARLARFTDIPLYVDNAKKIWEWMETINLLVEKQSNIIIHDGVTVSSQCNEITKIRWSYNYGVFLSGCAYLYDYTGDKIWFERAKKILETTKTFTENDVFVEKSCAPFKRCNNDQRSFRALFARCLSMTVRLIPDFYPMVRSWFEKSAVAAAQSCSGGIDGVTCGENWNHNGWDGVYGLGEQMSALETVLSVLTMNYPAPITSIDEGSSVGMYNAGLIEIENANNSLEIKTKDRIAAYVITSLLVGTIITISAWMFF